MTHALNRRRFLAVAPASCIAASALASGEADQDNAPTLADTFPTTPADRAEEFVGACHVRIDRVREMLAEDAGLAKASWDWGFGDWENAIGACSHTGRKDIIELLIAHGARPTLFTLATLDEIDAVRAVLENTQNADALEGPHSISLYDHARAGDAERVMEYLESKGLKRDDPFVMDRADAEQYFGQYAWGPGDTERFEIGWFERRSALTLARTGQTTRNLIPLGGHRFSPAGARHIVVRFDVSGTSAKLIVPRPAAPELVATRT